SLAGGATTFIQLTSSLQSGSTFYTSSGTVNALTIGSSLNLNNHTINNVGTPAAASDAATKQYVDSLASGSSAALLSSTNTWTAAQTFLSSVTISTAVSLGTSGQAVSVSSNAYLATTGGLVGIGTNSPQALLDINGDGASVLVPRKSTAGDPATGTNGA